MSSNGGVTVLDGNYYQSLMDNRTMMIENIIFTQEMSNLCLEKKIVSGEKISVFQKTEIKAEKVDCIIQSLQMKQPKYFSSFCEILMMCGQPLIAQLIQESATNEVEIDIEDLLSDMPMLKKSLRPKDKEQLQRYINAKVKTESMKSIVTHSKSNQRKESIARVTQIQQSWKFQKEIKVKEKESDDLKEHLMSIEEQLAEKQELLKQIKHDLKEKQRKQTEELQLAASFNEVNDRELKRSEHAVDLYKTVIGSVMHRFRGIIPEDISTQKLLHESSDTQIKKYDIEKRIELFTDVVDKVFEIYNILATEKVNFEILKAEVRDVQRLLFSRREPSPSDSLTSYVKEYQQMMTHTIQTLQGKIDLQDNFIHGKIPNEFIPVQYKNIKIPSEEREEYTEIIKELRTKVKSLESLLAAKEKDFQRFVGQKMPGEIEIFLDSKDRNGHDNHVGTFDPGTKPESQENNQNKPVTVPNGIPFSYSSKYKSRPPRIVDNKPKRTNVLKFGSVNFL